jgi:uncharacterized protein with PIN domain
MYTYRLRDEQTGETIIAETVASNALYWAESQGNTMSEAMALLSAADEGTMVVAGAIIIERADVGQQARVHVARCKHADVTDHSDLGQRCDDCGRSVIIGRSVADIPADLIGI